MWTCIPIHMHKADINDESVYRSTKCYFIANIRYAHSLGAYSTTAH